jgi:hypothetical protein
MYILIMHNTYILERVVHSSYYNTRVTLYDTNRFTFLCIRTTLLPIHTHTRTHTDNISSIITLNGRADIFVRTTTMRLSASNKQVLTRNVDACFVRKRFTADCDPEMWCTA